MQKEFAFCFFAFIILKYNIYRNLHILDMKFKIKIEFYLERLREKY